jgi:hypothetical protein
MKRLIPLVLAGLLALPACSPQNQASALVTAQKAAYTTKASYVALVTGADVYARLPRCTSPATATGTTPVCSDQNVLDQMVQAQKAASAAVNAFETASRNVAATPDIVSAAQTTATQALAALSTILDTYHIAHG